MMLEVHADARFATAPITRYWCEAMKILGLESRPVACLTYVNAARRGGVEAASIELTLGKAEGLPDDLEAMLITSDLQGVAPSRHFGGEQVLLGIAVAETYDDLVDAGEVPDSAGTAAILAGDLFSAAGGDRRGATGDVREVWRAFADRFRCVAGVAGNHDRFGTAREEERFRNSPGVHLLDVDVCRLDGLTIGGVGQVIGDPRREGRRDQSDFEAAVELVLEQSPDVLVLHQNPMVGRKQNGNPALGQLLAQRQVPLTICGHRPWDEPIGHLPGDRAVLNVHARVVILTR